MQWPTRHTEGQLEKRQAFSPKIPLSDKIRYAATNAVFHPSLKTQGFYTYWSFL